MSWSTRFNVFDDQAPCREYHGAPAHIRVVHRSDDGRHATLYSDHPHGVSFRQPSLGIGETFYVIEGSIRSTTEDGEAVMFRAGDLVYWSYRREIALEYSEDLRAVCFFWSSEPLPDLDEGEEIR